MTKTQEMIVLPIQKIFVAALICMLAACASTPPHASDTDLQKQVSDTERAFAKTMADRDFLGFQRFVSTEAIFFSGGKAAHGKDAIAQEWKPLYEGAAAPFSWEPQTVEVLPSGTLALSSGPVHDAKGKLVATFTSIWRLEAPDTWRIVFDKGNDVCEDKPH